MPLTFPDMSNTIAGEETASLREEYAAAEARRHAAAGERQQAENGLSRAKQEDAQAYAEAVRSGGKDPGPRQQKALEQQGEDAARRLAGELQALGAIEKDIAALRAERGDAWLDDLERLRAPLLAATQEQAAMLRASVDDLARLDAVAAWARTGRAKVPQRQTSVRNMAGQPLTLPRLLDAVQAALASWKDSPGPEVIPEYPDDETEPVRA